MNCLNCIVSCCKITPGHVWLNGELYLKSAHEPFEMNDFFFDIYKHTELDYRRFFKMDAMSKLGFLCSEVLLAGSDREQPKPDMGIILFNKNSSIEADVNYQKTIQNKEDFFPSPANFVYTLPNIVTGEIAIRNKIYGETAFYVLHRFATDTISEVVDDTMYAAGIKCALTGWIDVNISNNEVDAFMMLCVSLPWKTGTGKVPLYLPTGLKGVSTGEISRLTDIDIVDLCKKIKI